MDDDRDVFLPPKKFRYKSFQHRTEPSVAAAAADVVTEVQRARLPYKKTALSAYRTAAAAAPPDELVHIATSVSPTAQVSPASSASDSGPLKLAWCPYCQLPLQLLAASGAAAAHHLADCSQTDRSRLPECSDSVHCQSGSVSHYGRFAHLALARLRAYHSAAASQSLLSVAAPPGGGGGVSQPHVHRDVQHLRQEASFYLPPRVSAAAPLSHFSASASNLQLLREARQQPALATAPLPAAAAAGTGRLVHSPHGSLHSPLSVSLGSPHPSPVSPQAASPLPSAAVAPPPVTLGRSSPSSELFPMRSRANTMSPPRGGRRYGARPRSGSFNLPPRPRSSASLSLPPRRAGFSIAEIMEPHGEAMEARAEAIQESGALDLSVRRRRVDSETLQDDRQSSVSECISDLVERCEPEDLKLPGRVPPAHDSQPGEAAQAQTVETAHLRTTDSGSAGSKVTVSSQHTTTSISKPPKKRRLAPPSPPGAEEASGGATVAAPISRQPVFTSYFPSVSTTTTTVTTAVMSESLAEQQRTTGADVDAKAATFADFAEKAKELPSLEDTRQQWAKIMSKMRPSSVTAAQQYRTHSNGAAPHADRKCPFYKLIPGAPFAVDAFNYGPVPGVQAYFLSHFHYDHYRGLSKTFPNTLYCGKVTGNLVISRLKVPADRVRTLPMNEPRRVLGVDVTLLDANHCPGAVMFLFKLPDGRAFLHVGDFRADPSMESYPELWNTTIDRLYLDTTYCDPMYDFPSQSDILHQCVRIVNEAIQKHPKTLVVCGSYTIGKERVFLTIAEALDCLFWASADKRRTLHCLEERQIKRRLTTDQRLARIHVLPLGHLTMKTLQNYLKIFQSQYTHILAVKPTGWEHGKDAQKHGDFKPKISGNIAIYGVPYSEHSSYSELRRFVKFVQPREIIPTVNVGSVASRTLMETQFRQWLTESPLRPRAAAAAAGLQQSTQMGPPVSAAGSQQASAAPTPTAQQSAPRAPPVATPHQGAPLGPPPPPPPVSAAGTRGGGAGGPVRERQKAVTTGAAAVDSAPARS